MRKIEVLSILNHVADVEIIEKSTNLKELSFFYNGKKYTRTKNPEKYIEKLERDFNVNEAFFRNDTKIVIYELEQAYQLNFCKSDRYCVCLYIYALLKINILKNDNENGMMAIFAD